MSKITRVLDNTNVQAMVKALRKVSVIKVTRDNSGNYIAKVNGQEVFRALRQGSRSKLYIVRHDERLFITPENGEKNE